MFGSQNANKFISRGQWGILNTAIPQNKFGKYRHVALKESPNTTCVLKQILNCYIFALNLAYRAVHGLGMTSTVVFGNSFVLVLQCLEPLNVSPLNSLWSTFVFQLQSSVYKYWSSVSSPLDINQLNWRPGVIMDKLTLFLVSDCFGFFFVTINTSRKIARKKSAASRFISFRFFFPIFFFRELKDHAIARSTVYAKIVIMLFNNYFTPACWLRYFVWLPETLTFWRKYLFQCVSLMAIVFLWHGKTE